MKHWMRWALVSLVLVTLLGWVVQPAQANSKVNGHYETGMIWQPATCANGQVIVEDWAASVDVKTFFDNDGKVFMVEESVTQTGKIYLLDQPWKAIYYENEHWKNMFKPNGLMFGPGIVMKATIPGYGMIFQDIGRIVFIWDEERQVYEIVWMAGQHEFFDPAQFPYNYNYQPACDYLTALD